jgi:hypothetical protein
MGLEHTRLRSELTFTAAGTLKLEQLSLPWRLEDLASALGFDGHIGEGAAARDPAEMKSLYMLTFH